jgi:hypothetical protein
MVRSGRAQTSVPGAQRSHRVAMVIPNGLGDPAALPRSQRKFDSSNRAILQIVERHEQHPHPVPPLAREREKKFFLLRGEKVAEGQSRMTGLMVPLRGQPHSTYSFALKSAGSSPQS